MSDPQISVVVPTFQRRASVEVLLRSLAQQTLPPTDYEVIVAIDGSEDGTRELLETWQAPFALRSAWQPNRGRAAACNAGMRLACAPLLVILDDDMELTPDCLAVHLRAHAGGERIAVLGAVPVRTDADTAAVAQVVDQKFQHHLDKLAQPGYEIQFRDFYTGHVSIARATVEAVGNFDEDFKVYGNEDSELALRLLATGVRFVYEPTAVAYQHYTKDFAAVARDNIAKGHTAVLLARKYPDAYHHLRLSTYTWGSRKWRVLRTVLLGLSRVWAGTPGLVVRFMQWLERRHPARLLVYYDMAFDYFFWLGARQARWKQVDAPPTRDAAR